MTIPGTLRSLFTCSAVKFLNDCVLSALTRITWKLGILLSFTCSAPDFVKNNFKAAFAPVSKKGRISTGRD